MGEPQQGSKYRVPLIEFLSSTNVEPEDMVETAEPHVPVEPDPRREAPDRDRFAASG
ncbi:MAG: hypothetical protein M3P04_02465 [Actinomycetota bacterium]|nr:hypothetical protein [Actinomycetota bacterium]